jgi:phosphonate transport system substrate-binding protein
MKKLLLFLFLSMTACSFPGFGLDRRILPIPVSTITATPVALPKPTAPPGSKGNPLILALSPASQPSADQLAAGETLAAQLEKLTGYKIVNVTHATELEIVEALGKNNVHIAVLSPFGYLLARRAGTVSAGLASLKNGEKFYGAQFIANRKSGFTSFYDELRTENTAEAAEALAQFNNRKPCWSDPASASGYVIPLGLLTQVKVQVRPGAFLEGQPEVVRAVYAEGICDFGATFIDARQSPALEAEYPDVVEKVVVIWCIPAIIPYDVVSFSTSLPFEMRRALLRAFVDVLTNPDGKSALQSIYGIDALQPAEDSLYDQFVLYAEASGVDLKSLLK